MFRKTQHFSNIKKLAQFWPKTSELIEIKNVRKIVQKYLKPNPTGIHGPPKIGPVPGLKIFAGLRPVQSSIFFRALVRSSPKFSICFGPVPVRSQSVLVHESLIPGTNVNVGKCAQGICLPPTRFCWIDIVARGLNGIHSVTFSLFSHFSSLQITKKEKKTFYPRKK